MLDTAALLDALSRGPRAVIPLGRLGRLLALAPAALEALLAEAEDEGRAVVWENAPDLGPSALLSAAEAAARHKAIRIRC